MNKIKISFTALLTLILISVFATFAFAEEPVVRTSTNPAPGINVGEYNNKGEKATHKTHGDFQNNTNSCANCHSTHNGTTETLLKYSSTEYEMCLSCHDGTMGFYNVKGLGAGAGTFDDSHESASMHNVSSFLDAVVIGAAPGASAAVKENTDDLLCSSCHNPHGSVNDRLLKESVLNGELYATVAKGTKAISLELIEDPAFADLNAVTGTGLKITTSKGPLAGTDKINYANFCSTCHNEYLMKSGTARDTDGHYSHTTNSSSAGRNCASCHYAHGTDVRLLMDTQAKKVADYVAEGWTQEQAEGYMQDVTGDSNLKKFTNMAVCWTCHTSSHSEPLVGHGPENEGDPWNGPMPEQLGDPWAGTGQYWNWAYSSRHGWVPTFNGKASIK